MNYVERNLIQGEQIRYRTTLHWIVLFPYAVVALFPFGLGILFLLAGKLGAGLFLAGLGVLIFGWGLLRRRATEMAITNKRVIVKAGLIRRSTIEVFLSKIESIDVRQGILDRMLNCGSIVVRGTGGAYEPFKSVRSPLEFRRHIDLS
jgi:uncharacterized membrane protein YdbT with pleckstrin-like domain